MICKFYGQIMLGCSPKVKWSDSFASECRKSHFRPEEPQFLQVFGFSLWWKHTPTFGQAQLSLALGYLFSCASVVLKGTFCGLFCAKFSHSLVPASPSSCRSSFSFSSLFHKPLASASVTLVITLVIVSVSIATVQATITHNDRFSFYLHISPSQPRGKIHHFKKLQITSRWSQYR